MDDQAATLSPPTQPVLSNLDSLELLRWHGKVESDLMASSLALAALQRKIVMRIKLLRSIEPQMPTGDEDGRGILRLEASLKTAVAALPTAGKGLLKMLGRDAVQVRGWAQTFSADHLLPLLNNLDDGIKKRRQELERPADPQEEVPALAPDALDAPMESLPGINVILERCKMAILEFSDEVKDEINEVVQSGPSRCLYFCMASGFRD